MKLKQLTTAILFLLSSAVYAQDTIYFDKYESEIQNAGKVKFYRIIRRDSLDNNHAVATDYFKSGKVKSTASLADESSVLAKERKSGVQACFFSNDGKTKWLNNGKYMEWYKNGKLKKDIDFRNGGSNNLLITYWPNGQIKRKEKYDNNWKMLSGDCLDSDGSRVRFSNYFQSPVFNPTEFSSAQTYVNKNFQYPTTLSDDQLMGKMLIKSYINSNGKAYKNILIKGVQPAIDNEISNLFKRLPQCPTPAMNDGEPTSYILTSSVVICKPAYTVDLFLNPTGKDSVYYNKEGFIQKDRKGAETIELLSTNSGNNNELIQTIFYPSGKVKSSWTIDKKMSIEKISKTYKNLNVNSGLPVRTEFMKNRVLNGKSINWYESGQLKSKLNYLSNKLEGEQVYYAEDGTETNRAVFENGKLISGNTPALKVISEKSITEADMKPQFPGGESVMFEYLSKNIRYPISAQEKNIQGKVVVRFVIDTDGSVVDVEIVRSVNPDLDAEAVRVIQSMPNWIPGTHEGVLARVFFILPINFGLDSGNIYPPIFQNNNFPMQNNNINNINRAFPQRRF